jgi:hypothetical protein
MAKASPKRAKAKAPALPDPPKPSILSKVIKELWPQDSTAVKVLAAILVVAFFLRAYKLTTLFPVLVDESIYLRWAEIIHHQGQWFISLLDGKQPLQPWVLAIQRMVWDGDPLAGARFISVLTGLASVVGIFAVARRLSSELGGLIAAFLYACFPLTLLYDRLAYTEGFVNMFGVFIVLTSLWCFSESGESYKRELVPGIALALAMLTKQTLLLFWFFPALTALWLARQHARHWVLRLAVIYSFGIAAMVFCAVTVPEAPMLGSHDTVLHHTGFFASPDELMADPFTAFNINVVKLGGYLTTYLTWPGILAVLASLTFLTSRRSIAAWVIVSAAVLPWIVELFLLKLMFPTRYPYPHFWPLLVVIGMALAALWESSEEWWSDVKRRKLAVGAGVALVALPMLAQDARMFSDTANSLHERDHWHFIRSIAHVGYGVREAIAFLEQEAITGGPFVLLTDPIWGPPADVMAPFLNEKHGIRVYEAWWTQKSGEHQILPVGNAEMLRSHYERVSAGQLDFSRISRVYYVTDTDYNTPEAVRYRQPNAVLLKRFPKPENNQSIDVYRLK